MECCTVPFKPSKLDLGSSTQLLINPSPRFQPDLMIATVRNNYLPYLILAENSEKFNDCFTNNNKIRLLKRSCYSRKQNSRNNVIKLSGRLNNSQWHGISKQLILDLRYRLIYFKHRVFWRSLCDFTHSLFHFRF